MTTASQPNETNPLIAPLKIFFFFLNMRRRRKKENEKQPLLSQIEVPGLSWTLD